MNARVAGAWGPERGCGAPEARVRGLTRPILWLMLAGITAVPAVQVPAGAQSPVRTPRVGVLCPWLCPTPSGGRLSVPMSQKNPDDLMADEAFRLGLRDLGYVEGRNVVIEWRSALGRYERLPGLADELIQARIDVLVTVGAPWVRDFAQANPTLPIVLAQVADPVMGGLVTSLARPGRNITGLSLPSHELEGKQLELLKEAVPGLSTVAVLYNPDNPASQAHVRETEAVARTLGLRLQFVPFRGAHEADAVFTAIRNAHAGAVLLNAEPVILTNQVRLLQLAIRDRLPTISEFRDLADLGGLMTYGPDTNEMFRRAASYVDKILKGTRAGDLPMEQPMRFEMIVNLATARSLGVTLPSAILMRADRVIR
jgi:putative tryptophan/tyrosine transport system substrate-binding protein